MDMVMTDGGTHIPVIPVLISLLHVSVHCHSFSSCVCVCIVFSFCMYADAAVLIPRHV